jgi:tetratricopeptide (TPR) repeat protein
MAIVLSAALGACGAPRAYVTNPSAYDRVPPEWRREIALARLASDDGDFELARAHLDPLARAKETVIPVRVFLQEVELGLFQSGGHLGAVRVPTPEAAHAWLAEHYRAAAEKTPSATAYVLAARLETDAEQALALLEKARALDPECGWVHYGRAWWNASQRRFREARECVREAFRLDGGHLPTLRLHATMLAGAGEPEAAAAALEVWLDRTADDPLYAPAERANALLDLAALQVLLDRPGAALDLLDQLDPRALRDAARAEGVRAAAHQARGEYTAALAAVHRASVLEPGELLPLVQEAMLLAGVGDHAGERVIWERLLERTEPFPATDAKDPAAIDFQSLLFRLQAHTRLERLELEEESP